ncbi:MAG: hypothetical protein HON23_03730 [Rickettsiales bacterium]|nr:hypothetical protein [Rickettsiales bacterium]
MSNEKLRMTNAHTSINNLDILNTLAVSKYFKKFKFTDIQAEALSNILKKNQDAMISHKDMEDRLSTKSDVADVRSDITDVRSEIADVKSELKYDIQILRTDIAESKISTIKWQVGTMLILASLFIALIKF